MTTTGTVSVQAKNNSDVLDLAEYSTVESFMRKVFRHDTNGEAQAAAGVPSSSDVDEFERTSGLIESASKAIEALSTRCEILELELNQEREVCSEQVESIEALKRMVLDIKAEADSFESALQSMTTRCQASETRVAELEQNEKVVTLRAKKAESISSKLQRQVEEAFGQGSPIHSVMGSANLKQAAE